MYFKILDIYTSLINFSLLYCIFANNLLIFVFSRFLIRIFVFRGVIGFRFSFSEKLLKIESWFCFLIILFRFEKDANLTFIFFFLILYNLGFVITKSREICHRVVFLICIHILSSFVMCLKFFKYGILKFSGIFLAFSPCFINSWFYTISNSIIILSFSTTFEHYFLINYS